MTLTIRSSLYARAAIIALSAGLCALASMPSIGPVILGYALVFFLLAGSVVFQRYELRRDAGLLRLRAHRFGILVFDDVSSSPEPFFPFERSGRRTSPRSRWTVAFRGDSRPHVLWFHFDVDRALSLARSLNRFDGPTPRTLAWPCLARTRRARVQ